MGDVQLKWVATRFMTQPETTGNQKSSSQSSTDEGSDREKMVVTVHVNQ